MERVKKKSRRGLVGGGRGDQLMTVSQVATRLAVSDASVYRALREQRMPGQKILGCWRVDPRELAGWIEAQKPPKPEPAPPSNDILEEARALRARQGQGRYEG